MTAAPRDPSDQSNRQAPPPRARRTRPSRGVIARLRRGVTPRPRSRLRRRVGSVVRMIAALALVGGVYAAFAPSSQAAEPSQQLSDAAQKGQVLYNQSCITCHGSNAQGVNGRGPSLIGVGSAAVEFQVTTGRMPASAQQAQMERKKPQFTDDEARQIGAYIEALGGGPTLPEGTDLHSGADIANGGELFRVNCASCHAFGTGGGALSSGKYAPSLKDATDRQIYAAMLTGPENMPIFGDNQLTPEQKRDVIAYVQNMKSDTDPGGLNIGRIGPAAEGLVIFLVGMVGLLFATLWIAGKS